MGPAAPEAHVECGMDKKHEARFQAISVLMPPPKMHERDFDRTACTLNRQRPYRKTLFMPSSVSAGNCLRSIYTKTVKPLNSAPAERLSGAAGEKRAGDPSAPSLKKRDVFDTRLFSCRFGQRLRSTGLATTSRPKYWSGCGPSPRSVAKRPFPRNLRPTP